MPPSPPTGSLPARPDLQHLKKQAKDLLKAHAAGDLDACAALRHLPRLTARSDEHLLAASLTLHDAQNAVARQYGHDTWAQLRDAVQADADQPSAPKRAPRFDNLDATLRDHIEHLGFHSVGAYRIWCHKHGLDTSLEKTGEQLYEELRLHGELPTKPTLRRNFCPAEERKITAAYRGETDGLWSGWMKPFEGVEDPGERDALHRLLLHCARYADIGGPAVWQVASYYREWRHPVEEWIPKGRDRSGHLIDLTRFLLGKDELPALDDERAGVIPPSQHFARVAATRDTVLSEQEVLHYEERGYVKLPGAFSADVAENITDFLWQELERRHGFRRGEPETWSTEVWDPDRQPHHWTNLRLNRSKEDPVFDGLGSPRLLAALEELTGLGQRNSWGAFTPTFPTRDEAPWDVPTKFFCYPDMDGRWGCRIHILLSTVPSRSGARVAVEGSHRLVRRYLADLPVSERFGKYKEIIDRFLNRQPYFAQLSGRADDPGDRIRRFMEETTVVDGVPLRVVELTGEPGDVWFCEGSLMTTRSRNMTDTPVFTRG